jgi:S1-C subfamily serine protease
MKKYLALILFLTALLALGDRWHREHAARFDKAQSSTVLLESSKSFGSGSGFVIKRSNPDGQSRLFVWTASHVVCGDNDVKVSQVVRLNGVKVGSVNFIAHVLARDSSLDLSLLWLEAPPSFFSSSTFGGTEILPIGTKIFHCGNFLGAKLENSVSSGIVSQVGVSAPGFPWQVIDQTTALVEHGSSGGAVFSDRSGAVVGVATGVIEPGITLFVPNRAVHAFVVVHSVEWAFSGGDCPSDGKLLLLRDAARVSIENVDPFFKLLLGH